MLNTNETTANTAEKLADLVYELLDAHADTICLASDIREDLAWAAHVDYLRALQRVGHEALARAAC